MLIVMANTVDVTELLMKKIVGVEINASTANQLKIARMESFNYKSEPQPR